MKKSVNFSDERNRIYILVKWQFAYRQARKGDNGKTYLDRLRFEKRIIQSEIILHLIFDKELRSKIFNERFNVTF